MKGFISEDEAAVTIPTLRAERDAIRADLDAAGRAPVVLRLRQSAIASYLAAINRLEQALERDAMDGEIESRLAFRELVQTVVVRAPRDGSDVWLTITGSLAQLAHEAGTANARNVGGIGGSGRGTRTPDTRIMIPLL